MKISIENIKNIKRKNGFTLIELVVVIAGLSTLAAISIPGVIDLIKLSKIDEAKAIMNGYISDCLGQYRISTDPSNFYNNAIPDDLDEVRLETLGYKVQGVNSKCSWMAITPSDEKDKFRYSFDYRISVDGKVLKTAVPTVQRTLNSCRGWAGSNCSLSPEKAAEFAAAAALAEKKNKCLTDFGLWRVNNGNGNTVTWNSSTKACDKVAWLFDGRLVADEEAYEALLKQKFGTVCQEWRDAKNQANYKSKIDNNGQGIGETRTECNKAKYWFHSGRDFNTEVEWNTFNLNYQLQACNQSKLNAINKNHEGAFTFGPYKVPDPPCGKTIYLCDGKSYSSNDDFQNSPCVQRKIEEERRKAEEEQRKKDEQAKKDSNKKGKCDGVNYNKQLCQSPMFKSLDMCNCAPGGKWYGK